MGLIKKIFSTNNEANKSGQILIVDPVEIAANRKKDSKSKHFDYLDVELALLNLYRTLSEVPPKILEHITLLIVINPGVESIAITDDRQKEFFVKLEQASKESFSSKNSKLLFKLFQKAMFINYTNDAERVSLLTFTRSKSIVFFDITLSRAIINHLYMDPNNHQITGYRNDGWVKIDDVLKYISIAYTLTVENIPLTDETERLKRSQEICNEYFQSFLAAVKLNSSGKFCIILNDDSVPSFPNLRQALEEVIGGFFLSECTTDNHFILSNKERLIIKNVNKLPHHKLVELCSIILNGEYRDKLVILQASKQIDLADFPEFKVFPFWSLKKADEIFQKYLEENKGNQNIIEKLAADIEQFITDDITIKQKDKRLQEIKELKTANQFANPKKYNFWYKFQSLDFPSVKSMRNKILEELEEYFKKDIPNTKTLISDAKDWIKFEHLHRKKHWDIFKKNGTRLGKQSYSSSRGIKYVAWLVKYYQHPSEGIKIKDLVEEINKWNGIQKIKDYKTHYPQLVAMSIRKDLEKIDKNLLYLSQDFKISNICLYDPETDLKIHIEDEDMPPKE